jgi:hypothetical protein
MMTDRLYLLPFLHTLERLPRLMEEIFHISGSKGRLDERWTNTRVENTPKKSIQLTRVEVFGDVFIDEKDVEILGWSRSFRQIGYFFTLVRHRYLRVPVTHDGQAMT